MQSLVPLAAPSGQPQGTGGVAPLAIPLLHENRARPKSYPHSVPSVDSEAARPALTHRRYSRDVNAERQRVLFVCTHNSARSQMAEGMLRAWAGDRFEALSAGTEATAVRPEAISAMAEIGIDISGQRSKTLEPFLGQSFSWLVTVCDQAREACPTLPGVARQEHWSIEDPSAAGGTAEERLEAFRRARDVLRDRIGGFIRAAGSEDQPPPPPTPPAA